VKLPICIVKWSTAWQTNDASVRERIKKDLIDDVKNDPASAENVTYPKSSLGLKMGF